MIFYNDNDAYVCRWLRNLMLAGHLPPGIVDDRSILELAAGELRPFRQCHFFAGIGGWAYALALAGWPEDREVWTGSCPCQPLSVAGLRHGHADERHLWPAFYRLIAECRPATVFGEQVASKDGREWLAGARADMEALGYAVGAADLCAAGVGAPHIRQRLFWVADAGQQRRQQVSRSSSGDESADERQPNGNHIVAGSGATGGRARQPWQDSIWLPCHDGKARRIEPGTFPLAHGVPARVGRLRGYGNAIVPQVAAELIRAFMGD